jgi:hypothetical protein
MFLGSSIEDSEYIFSECEENEFACNDGSCIPQIDKCNGQQDCLDNDDEENCREYSFIRSIFFLNQYKKLD